MVKPRERPSIRERFERFHAANPGVYRVFKRFAWDVKKAGRSRWSADAIIQRIRWFFAVETDEPEFKINDHYSAYYARMLMREDPDNFDGFFELRTTRQELLLAAAQRDGRLC